MFCHLFSEYIKKDIILMRARLIEKFDEHTDPIEDMGIGYSKDIQALINGVSVMDPTFYDNPNGPYEMTCPFCYGNIEYGGNRSNPTMVELPHTKDCIWLIAKKLDKVFNKE
jgi:hypothetical protein